MLKSKLVRLSAITKILCVTMLGFFSLSVPALAADPHGLDGTAKALNYNVSSGGGLYSTVGVIVQAFLSLLGFIFFGLMIYAGLRWMLARGQEEFVTKAKDTLRNSIIGLVIIIAAYGITALIFRQLNQTPTTGTSGPSTPNTSPSLPSSNGSGQPTVAGCCEIMSGGQISSCQENTIEADCYAGKGSNWVAGSCLSVSQCSNLPQVICYPTGGNDCVNAPQELCGTTGDACTWDTRLKKCIGSNDSTNCRADSDKDICDADPKCGWVPAF